MDTFDFIVVGGGTAGSVVASRLSQDAGRSVLLLEAGPESGPQPDDMSDPARAPKLYGTSVDWNYTTVPQESAGGQPHTWARGKVLGGSSSINAMAHIRGHRSNYDRWRDEGASGWGFDDLLPYFKRSETTEGRNPDYRGTSGPMRVTSVPAMAADESPLIAAVVGAGYKTSADINGEDQEGSFWFDMNTVDGRRQSAADAYLRPVLARPNLTVRTEALATRIHIVDKRAVSVAYQVDGVTCQARATKEIVLAAGAIGTPQLLLLSGVGPTDDLQKHGIATVADLPGVGKNLQDHVQSSVVFAARKPLHSGPYGVTLGSALLRTASAGDAPNVQLLLVDFPMASTKWNAPTPAYTISFALVDPHSRGTVELSSSDPSDAPVIDPGFLTDDRDVADLRAALDIARRVGASPAFEPWNGGESVPGASTDDASTIAYLRETARTYFHPVGTAKMGSDSLAVVDSRLRVHGLTGLRAADASIMPTIPTANTNATVLAIAERASEMIARDASPDEFAF